MDNYLNNLPTLIRASLEGDIRTVEFTALNLVRKTKRDYPDISNDIAEILATYKAGAPLSRSLGMEPPPTDKESFISLVNVNSYDDFEENIVLINTVECMIDRFLKERLVMQKLLSNGIKPPKSILLYGLPGVGKTLLSKYVSYKLKLPLITFDLSSSISSYLGKTGQNIKKVLDYAKSNPSILLLDEFDAIAKRRDDPSDLGELKRIVNVLLKELEEWPNHSIVIGATNHPEFLDKAIWRRFDLIIEIPLPNYELRYKLWKNNLDKDFVKIDENFISVISQVIDDISPSDIKQISEQVLRQVIVEGGDIELLLIKELKRRYGNIKGDFNKVIINEIKRLYGKKMTQFEIGELLGISASTVNYHINKK